MIETIKWLVQILKFHFVGKKIARERILAHLATFDPLSSWHHGEGKAIIYHDEFVITVKQYDLQLVRYKDSDIVPAVCAPASRYPVPVFYFDRCKNGGGLKNGAVRIGLSPARVLAAR